MRLDGEVEERTIHLNRNMRHLKLHGLGYIYFSYLSEPPKLRNYDTYI